MHGTYEFRKEMLQIHRPDILDEAYCPKVGEIAINDDWCIVIPKSAGRVLVNAAQDRDSVEQDALKAVIDRVAAYEQ